MKVITAYICVVLVWSTTPLAIKWSNSSLDFMAAVAIRMNVAAVLCCLALFVLRRKLIQQSGDLKAMFVGALGLFPNMVLVYWSALHIPSGLISVILGVYPFLVGFFSWIILGESTFNVSRLIALFIAVVGLLLIHIEQMALGPTAVLGVAGILLSSVFFAFSTVLLKKLSGQIDSLRQLTGSLLFSSPFFLLVWYIFGEPLPELIDVRSLIGVSYLILAGSLVGGLMFYFVLASCSVSTVSLIPLMTPVLALFIGNVIEGEIVSRLALVGSSLILFSLAVYQGVLVWVYRRALILKDRWLVQFRSACALCINLWQ